MSCQQVLVAASAAMGRSGQAPLLGRGPAPPAHCTPAQPSPPHALSPCHRSEWADFDEKLGESVSIMGISSEFRAHKR